MRTIRASEISAFVYCQRAWWYHKRGQEPSNQSDLASGNQLHARHGRAVLAAGCLQSLAYGLLLAALVIGAIYATLHFIS